MTTIANRKDKMNFMIIEDEEDLRMIYEENIRDWCTAKGIVPNIIEATDGVMAAQKFNNMEFHALIVDINMPKRNGIEFLKSAQRRINECGTRVMLVSGALTKSNLLEALDIGVKDVLVKPFKSDDFNALLEKILSY